MIRTLRRQKILRALSLILLAGFAFLGLHLWVHAQGHAGHELADCPLYTLAKGLAFAAFFQVLARVLFVETRLSSPDFLPLKILSPGSLHLRAPPVF